jgi:hypothetical protein
MYRPSIARWLSVDPIGVDDADQLDTALLTEWASALFLPVPRLLDEVSPDNRNLVPLGNDTYLQPYTYVLNRPTSLSDPSGEQAALPTTCGKRSIQIGNFWLHRTTANSGANPIQNGCSSPLLRGHFGFWDFTTACNIHDLCYGASCGANKKACDDAFLADMQFLCGFVTSLQRRLACMYWAFAYYRAVHIFGEPFFQQAQDLACKWVCCTPPTSPSTSIQPPTLAP